MSSAGKNTSRAKADTLSSNFAKGHFRAAPPTNGLGWRNIWTIKDKAFLGGNGQPDGLIFVRIQMGGRREAVARPCLC